MSFKAASTSQRPQQSEFEYHLRIYQDADKQQVHILFENAMFWHSHSPLRPLLKIVVKSPITRALCLTSLFGAVIWPRYATLGTIIFSTAAGTVLLQIGFIFYLLLKFTKKSLQDDLNDIREHYKLVSCGNSDEVEACLTPSGPRAFWVVEGRHKVSGERELAGCGGIDIVQKEGKSVGELRHMVVSGQHLRRGIAMRIVHAVVAHAKSHGLPSIHLSTSNAQGAAINLYKRIGWVEEERQDISLFVMNTQIISMCLYLEE